MFFRHEKPFVWLFQGKERSLGRHHLNAPDLRFVHTDKWARPYPGMECQAPFDWHARRANERPSFPAWRPMVTRQAFVGQLLAEVRSSSARRRAALHVFNRALEIMLAKRKNRRDAVKPLAAALWVTLSVCSVGVRGQDGKKKTRFFFFFFYRRLW